MQLLNEVDIGLRKTILGTECNNHITNYDKDLCGGTFKEAYR